VHLIRADGSSAGVVPLGVALQAAEDAELDLVEVAPNAHPPVVKVANWGKLQFQAQKSEREQRRHGQSETKELRLRPTIGEHDYRIKVNKAGDLLGRGHRVRVVVQVRGRIASHPEQILLLVDKLTSDLAAYGTLESRSSNGRDHVLMMVPPRRH
jgi:translation initiation factor IF-3